MEPGPVRKPGEHGEFPYPVPLLPCTESGQAPSPWWAYALQAVLGLAAISAVTCAGIEVLGMWVRREWPW